MTIHICFLHQLKLPGNRRSFVRRAQIFIVCDFFKFPGWWLQNLLFSLVATSCNSVDGKRTFMSWTQEQQAIMFQPVHILAYLTWRNYKLVIWTFVPCILILLKFFYSPTDALVSYHKNNIKIYVKICIQAAPTCFGAVTPSSGSALMHSLMMVWLHRNMSEPLECKL